MKVLKNILRLALYGFFFISFETIANTYHIGISLLTQQHPFYIELTEAIKTQAKIENVKLSLDIANQDLNKQLSDIENFIINKVDAIILSPVDSKGVMPIIQKAKSANIPVFTVDISTSGENIVSHVATDNYSGGLLAGKLMGQLLNNKGNVAIIDYPNVQSVVDRINGFKEGLAYYPGVNIVVIQSGITRSDALVTAQNIIEKNPNLNGIFGFGDDAALAAVIAAKKAGLDNIKIIGFDGMPEAINAVNTEKTFVAVIKQFPDEIGFIILKTAVDYLNGKNVPKLITVTPGFYMNMEASKPKVINKIP